MTPEEFRRLLHQVRVEADATLRTRFDRSLPFGDALFDRWERARALGFGEGASIYDSTLVFGEVRVGAGSWVGPFVLLDGSGGGISIGATCSISAGVHVYTHDTVRWALSGGRAARRTGAVSIGDCCHIGAQSVVVAGITIGSRCVVAANSLVNRDVPARSIVGGTPARRLGRVEGEGEAVRLVFERNAPGAEAADDAADDGAAPA